VRPRLPAPVLEDGAHGEGPSCGNHLTAAHASYARAMTDVWSGDDAARRVPVIAAGGVVLDGTGDGRQVLVVHRPVYDDWSLPKGHVETGESLADAALREVAEETGVAARIVAEAGITEHTVRLVQGEVTKRVHWFVMRPEGTQRPLEHEGVGDGEVDRAAWWPVAVARTELTYLGERDLLARVATDA
jgi:8-oxo-(d)GTP phosphatase